MHAESRLVKKPGWRIALYEFLIHAEDVPFSWGLNDCVMFVADAVRAMTGIDPAIAYRGTYGSAEKACSLVRLRSLEERFDDILGPRLPSVRMATYGDICLFDSPLGDTAAVVTGTFLTARGMRNLVRLPLRLARAVWRIPEGDSCLQR